MKERLISVFRKEALSTKVPISPSKGVLIASVVTEKRHLMLRLFFIGGGNLKFRAHRWRNLQYSNMEEIVNLINSDRELLKMLEDKVRIMSL